MSSLPRETASYQEFLPTSPSRPLFSRTLGSHGLAKPCQCETSQPESCGYASAVYAVALWILVTEFPCMFVETEEGKKNSHFLNLNT